MYVATQKKKSRNPLGLRLFLKNGAEGETRTRTGVRPLDPEPIVYFTWLHTALDNFAGVFNPESFLLQFYFFN